MRRLVLAAVGLLIFSIPVLAQDNYPRVELFAGYGYLSLDEVFSVTGDRLGTNGWNVSVTGNFHKNIGITGDFSGYYGSDSATFPFIGTVDVKQRGYAFLVGPRIAMRTDRATPYVHALFGAERGTREIFGVPVTDTNFTMAFGGGVDVNLGKKIAIRVFEVDYVNIRNGFSSHNFAVRTGIVFRLGGGS